MANEIILDTKLIGDIQGDFYIPSYQRGYRWSETEVTRLLDDVYATCHWGLSPLTRGINDPNGEVATAKAI